MSVAACSAVIRIQRRTRFAADIERLPMERGRAQFRVPRAIEALGAVTLLRFIDRRIVQLEAIIQRLLQ
jgi:hypothetical protein